MFNRDLCGVSGGSYFRRTQSYFGGSTSCGYATTAEPISLAVWGVLISVVFFFGSENECSLRFFLSRPFEIITPSSQPVMCGSDFMHIELLTLDYVPPKSEAMPMPISLRILQQSKSCTSFIIYIIHGWFSEGRRVMCEKWEFECRKPLYVETKGQLGGVRAGNPTCSRASACTSGSRRPGSGCGTSSSAGS